MGGGTGCECDRRSGKWTRGHANAGGDRGGPRSRGLHSELAEQAVQGAVAGVIEAAAPSFEMDPRRLVRPPDAVIEQDVGSR